MRHRSTMAEFAGTFGLVFLGTGSVLLDARLDGALGVPGIALAFGLAVWAMIVLFGRVSGAHINPAVTVGFCLRGSITARRAAVYLLAQAAGATAASGVLRLLDPDHPTLGATLPAVETGAAFGMELGLTAALMASIYSADWARRRLRIPPAVLIGGVVALEAGVAGPATGASMNPARSLGPALVSGHTAELWLYLTAPILGATLVSVLVRRRERPSRS